jgi:hypothetical protein
MSKVKIKRSFNDILNLFNEDKLTPGFLFNNLKTEERKVFDRKIYNHQQKYLNGRTFTKKQMAVIKSLCIMRCKRSDCIEYHSKFMEEWCKNCTHAKKESQFLKYNVNESTDVDCSICISCIDQKEEMATLICKHNFHKECLLTWLKCNLNCPCCRTNFKKYMK